MVHASWGETVTEEELGELALAERHQSLSVGLRILDLHLHALAEIHERCVDGATFGESGTRCLCLTCTFRSWQCVREYLKADYVSLTGEISNGHCAARPRPGHAMSTVTLLDLHAEEAVTA